ncbi:FLYWCH-type zinc finger-containing protein 1 [Frankliniella fusca]|uniref:FLYWCH-type zinc finger-containing protein 1 n=1 Tax=Frankliniella fusca TaxID=407009 RepID=A0AAE1HPG8_9NEOP|nr:FLYWCH-type zinc finger-containing protein 1 [Frankliniella fusca]
MERVEGVNGGRYVYLHLNFIYLLSSIHGPRTYLKCHQQNCSATANFVGDDVHEIGQHNHDPDLVILDLVRFKNELRRLARDSPDDYRRIYDATSLRYPQGARKFGFPAASQMMQRIRKAHTLLHPSWSNWASDLDRNAFFRETVVAVDGTECAVFVSHAFSDLVRREGWRAHADGTFKSVPLHPEVEQLFSLHAIDEDAHGQRTQAVLHRAIDVCLLKPLIQTNVEASKIARMLMTLPLLPMDLIVRGLDFVEAYAERKALAGEFSAMFQYMRTY